MAYSGNGYFVASFPLDRFNGDGVTRVFTLSVPPLNAASILVDVNNVGLSPINDYSVSGNTLTLTSAPSPGLSNIVVRQLSYPGTSYVPAPNSITVASLASGFTLPIVNGGTNATTQQLALNNLAGATTNGLYLRGNGTNVTLSAIQAGDVPTLNQNTTGQAGSVANSATFNSLGNGVVSGTTFNGSTGVTISYNTIGAPSVTGAGASGTWGINISGNAASANTASNTATANTANQVANSLTFSSSGNGGSPGTAFNGSSGITISYNSVGALPVGGSSSAAITLSSLGIGTAAGGAGEVRATGNITAFYSSDLRLKENVLDITDALTKAAGIGGKTFDWKESYMYSHGGEDPYFMRRHDFGVIAQDVERFFPTAVRRNMEGNLVVDYVKLVALAFAAIRELDEELKKIKTTMV